MKLGVPMDVFARFAERRRRQVSQLLLNSLKPDPNDTCIELGGPTNGLTGVTTFFTRYLVINIDGKYIKNVYSFPEYNKTCPLHADATVIPLKDASVDYVISNALLEHIPTHRRNDFALEVRRVARKGYFISAPNYWFPLEPHYYMPFFQFLPEAFKHWLAQRVRFGWMYKDSYEAVSLPTRRELRRLFPDAVIGGLSFSGVFPETIFAWKRISD